MCWFAQSVWLSGPQQFGDTARSCILDAVHMLSTSYPDVPQKPGRNICLYNSYFEDSFYHFLQLLFGKMQKIRIKQVTSSNEPFLHKSYQSLLAKTKFWTHKLSEKSTIWLESPKFAMEMQSYFRDDALAGGLRAGLRGKPTARCWQQVGP